MYCTKLLISGLKGYGKTVSHVVIGLKTAKGTKQLKVSYNTVLHVSYSLFVV